VELVAGSSTRGGARAFLQLLQLLAAGRHVCITPDGPKGPARQVKPGVVHLAQRSGCAVVPMGLALTRRRRLRSWDRSVLPLPFGRVVLTLGAPLRVPAADPAASTTGACSLERSGEALGRALDASSAWAGRQLTAPGGP